jgi:diguanylate cyclase (GGDEF)-like protein
VSARDFRHVAALFGYEAALLLDARGRALQVLPANPAVLGQDLTRKYRHLRAAVGGRTAVSVVVPSAARGVPVVAFATPFGPPGRRRVFSGAFDVSKTPIGAYLRNVNVLRGGKVYLVDTAGAIVSSNRDDLRGLNDISDVDPALDAALRERAAGRTRDGYEFASHAVAGTPWRLVMSAPRAQLLAPLAGSGRYVPWLYWAGLVLLGFVCARLVGNLIESRRRLRTAVGELDRLARTDPLTSIYNRRQIAELLDAAVATSARHGQALSVLMVDVDRFKAINDTHGHNVGDGVLCAIAASLRDSLRAGDFVGRWGGEEFLIVLPSTGPDGALVVAQRVRRAVTEIPLVVGGHLLPMTVSIGVADFAGEDVETLVGRADAALYAAKAAGRNTVTLSAAAVA